MTRPAHSTLLALALLAVSAASWAQSTIAIKGARIIPGDGPVLERGTVVIRGDRVLAVGPDVEIGADAQVIDGAGLTVYPGLIDAFCLAGIAPPPAAQPASTQPQAPSRRGQPAARPAQPPAPLVWRKATEGFNSKSAAIQALRNNGYTTALFGTRGVLTPGENVLMSLAPGESQAMVVRDRTAVNVNTLSRGSAYPGTLMGAFAFLRQALYDGIDQRNRKPEKPDARLQALGDAATGDIPLIYAAQTENDIKRALRLGREFTARLVILGGREAEKVLPQLKQRNTPVILTDDWSPAVALHKAGVPFALASNKIEMTAGEANELREKRAALVEKGLPSDVVLAALTSGPAAMLAMSGELGSIKAGKLANLAVVEGDLFKKDGKVKFVLIKGQRIDPAPIVAEGIRRGRVPEDGAVYPNVSEDDADDHGDGGGL